VFAASPRGQRNSGLDRAMASLDEQHFRTALARFLVSDRGNDLPLTSQQPRFARPLLGVLRVMAILRQPQVRLLDNDCRAPREVENQNRSSGPTTTSP
jgi:hypothetical protein